MTLETYPYQPGKEADKNALEFKIDQLEEAINVLQMRIGSINNQNLRRPLEVQLDMKKRDVENFKKEILKLEKEISEAENNDGPLN